jgi:uncharacterized protein (TIGR02145 family)
VETEPISKISFTAAQFCQSGTNEVKDLCGTATFTASQFCDHRDDKIYKKVTINTQTWMAENLNYNADGSWCYGDNTGGDSQNRCGTYGRLYNWNTAMAEAASSTANPSGVQGVCPSGWHLPSQAEWDALNTFIQSDKGCSNCDAKHLKAENGWDSNGWDINGNGLDSYGFSALPGGLGRFDDSFFDVGNYGYWWTASEYYIGGAYSRHMSYYDEYAYWGNYDKSYLRSVRCLKD